MYYIHWGCVCQGDYTDSYTALTRIELESMNANHGLILILAIRRFR